jgi:hypothetical protein
MRRNSAGCNENKKRSKWPVVRKPAEARKYFVPSTSLLNPGPIQLRIRRKRKGFISRQVKGLGYKPDRSSPLSVAVTNNYYLRMPSWHGKGKATPIQVWTGTEGSRRLRLPEFLDNHQLKVSMLLSLRTGRPYLHGIPQVIISTRGWVDSRAIVRPEAFNECKIPMTTSGIVPATFRLVAKCLNHLLYRVLPSCYGQRQISFLHRT